MNWHSDAQPLTHRITSSGTGKYFLQTHSNIFNLSRGMAGIRNYKVKLTRLLPPIHDGTKLDLSIPDEVENDVYY